MSDVDVPERPRVIGRILSLGYPLPGIRVDNYNFVSAPAFFDYDALVVDPSSLSELIETICDDGGDARTFGGVVVRNRPTAAAERALSQTLLRRRDETSALLERGGVVVCFAHPEIEHRNIVDLDALGDYYWLPPPDGLTFRELLLPGEGTQVDVVDYQHPLASFVEAQRARVAYRAHAPSAAVDGERVFARSRGGAAVGFEIPARAGRIIFLPALKPVPQGDARYAASDALQAGVRRALGVVAEGREPRWTADYALPGLVERAAALAAAESDLARARAGEGAARLAYDELARFRSLLWQEGAVGLDDVVLDGLRRIGVDVYATNPEEFELRIDGTPVLCEIEASERPVDLAAHQRLRQRLERALERRGVLRGVLFVNGDRLTPPSTRRHVTDAVRLAAETMRYCIAPTSGLYNAVAAECGGDSEAAAAYRRGLLQTDGLLEPGS